MSDRVFSDSLARVMLALGRCIKRSTRGEAGWTRRVQSAKRKLVYRLFQWLHASYYRFAFGRKLPFGRTLEKLVHDWERQRRKGDIPTAREVWDTQYRTNKWSYMERLDELARYAVITGYIAYLKSGGTVLDVGCGEGILFERYQPYGYAKYVGLDISEVALAKLMPKQNAQTVFFQADAETYQPTELYDVIVFNETLYYFHDPFSVIVRYAQALKPEGLLIISTYVASRRAMAILRSLKTRYPVVDETQTRHGAKSWLCTVLKPAVAAP
jgi:2-polyprenyl-3-methyl-5-hydroxy-6-metoxy-1,4-benzoquinol methylase